jgi:hypothetical protein
MLFKGNPLYVTNVCGKMVKFNHIGEFTTEDPRIIEELSKNTKVTSETVKTDVKKTKKTNEVNVTKATEIEQPLDESTVNSELQSNEETAKTDESSDELNKARAIYKEKFGKKAFGGWTIEEITAKLNEEVVA